MQRRPISLISIFVLGLLMTVPVFSAFRAVAQTNPAQVVITNIGADKFPEVNVHFQVLDSDRQFISGVTSVAITDNDQVVSSAPVTADDKPTRTIFLLDLSNAAAIRSTTLPKVRKALRFFADG